MNNITIATDTIYREMEMNLETVLLKTAAVSRGELPKQRYWISLNTYVIWMHEDILLEITLRVTK